MSTHPATLINGVEADYVSIADRGLHYGDGLFETIKLEQGALCYWQQHYDRLTASAQRLALACPSQQQLQDDIQRLLEANQSLTSTTAVVKIIVTRGSGERGYRFNPKQSASRIVQLAAAPERDSRLYEQGIAAMLCQHRLACSTELAGIKHLNRLDNVLASAELGKRWQEGVVLNQHGNVIEGCFSNVFCLHGNTLYTPALNDAGVDGIIRQRLLQLAPQASFTVEVGDFGSQQLFDADEIFFCNSLIGLWPVRLLADKVFTSFEQTRKLARLLQQDEKQYVTRL